MFNHILLFKSNDPEAIKLICEHVASIKSEIPGLLSVTYAENLTDYAQGYNQMAIMCFKRREDFEGWKQHPYHQVAVNELKEIAERMSFDYEC